MRTLAAAVFPRNLNIFIEFHGNENIQELKNYSRIRDYSISR